MLNHFQPPPRLFSPPCLFVVATEFKAINWLPTKHRVDQNICVTVMNLFNGTAPAYADEIFHPADESRVTQRSTKFRLNVPFRKNNTGQKCLSYQGPKWNSLPSDLKSTNNVNTLRYKERKMTYMCTIDTAHPLFRAIRSFQSVTVQISCILTTSKIFNSSMETFSFIDIPWRDHYGNKVTLTF